MTIVAGIGSVCETIAVIVVFLLESSKLNEVFLLK